MNETLQLISSAAPSEREIVGLGIRVSNYELLASVIPDDVVDIDEVYPVSELAAIYQRFARYLGEDALPFLGTLGGNAVCIGFAHENFGRIYYYDFDFGLFELDEALDEFLAKLVPDEK